MNPRRSHLHDQRTLTWATRAVRCSVALGLLLLAAPASAEDESPAPMLRISVDNGHTSAKAGDKLDYTISVENLGTEAANNLRISQTMPPGLTFRSADRMGEARKDGVVWHVDIAPSSTMVLHTTMKLGATSDEVLRLATVACASVSAAKPPIVCASHSDELPAGAQAADADNKPASPASSDSSSMTGFVRVGVTIALLAAVGALAMRFRRRRSAAGAPLP
jgi:uncharacterized repeat protein (TIGR01451 family)